MPDSARHKETGAEVYTIDLYHEIRADPSTAERIKKTEYICLFCNAPMEPVAILPNSIPVPYFRIKKNYQHEVGCFIYGYEQLVNKRRKKPASTPSGFPCGYPNRLCLITSREITNNKSPSVEKKEAAISQSNYHNLTNKNRNWEVKTIAPLVKQFVNLTHPIDRALHLYVPGVSATTYGGVFQKVVYRKTYQYNSTKIYFARLQYKFPINFNNTKIKIPLFEGNWQQGQFTEQYFLEIDTSSWPESHKDVLKRQINACLLEIKERKNEKNAQPWIFFLGQQATDGSCTFRLLKNDYKLIYCLVDDALSTERNSTFRNLNRTHLESYSHNDSAQDTSSYPQKIQDKQSIERLSITPLIPKNKDNQASSDQKDSFDFKAEVNPNPSLKEDQSLQEPLELNQYAYDSQSLPCPNEGTNKTSFQQQTNFSYLEFNKSQNQPISEKNPSNNNVNKQTQNIRSSKRSQRNQLENFINILCQKSKNWLIQVWQWLRGR